MTIALNKLRTENNRLNCRVLNNKQLCWLVAYLLVFFELFRVLHVLEVFFRSAV